MTETGKNRGDDHVEGLNVDGSVFVAFEVIMENEVESIVV